MKFNYQTELQKIIENKQLAEVRFHSSPGFPGGWQAGRQDGRGHPGLALMLLRPPVSLKRFFLFQTQGWHCAGKEEEMEESLGKKAFWAKAVCF